MFSDLISLLVHFVAIFIKENIFADFAQNEMFLATVKTVEEGHDWGFLVHFGFSTLNTIDRTLFLLLTLFLV